MKLQSNIYVPFDGQAGSSGKGGLIGYLAIKRNIMLTINNNMANSGHTFVFDNGMKIITTHLPIAFVNPYTTLCIGPGAVINPITLNNEIIKYKDLLGDREINIHPRASIILEKHVDFEKQNIRSGSTFKGCAAAQCDKILRKSDVILAKDYYTSNPNKKVKLIDTSLIVHYYISRNESMIIEASQGFDLDINYGLDYPYTTSRGCTISNILADCSIPPTKNIISYMIFRPYPIRISNSTNLGLDIYSGDYNNSDEITWDIIAKRCGAPKDISLEELTTVTKKIRRVFEFNYDRFKKAIEINDPTFLVLNFAQYINYNDLNVNNILDLSDETNTFIERIQRIYKKKIAYVKTGEKYSNITDMYVDPNIAYHRGCA